MTILLEGSGTKGLIKIDGMVNPMLDSETVNRSLVMKFGSLVSPDTMTITNDDKPGEVINVVINKGVAVLSLPDKSSKTITSNYKREGDLRVITLSAVSNALHVWGIGKVSNGRAALTPEERLALARQKAHAKADALDNMLVEVFEMARKRKPKTVKSPLYPVPATVPVGETKADQAREKAHKMNATRQQKAESKGPFIPASKDSVSSLSDM